MQRILSEFSSSMANIKNNFYFSFLSLNFLKQKPFSSNVMISGDLKNRIISAASLNEFGGQDVQEFGNSIRRHTLNDIVVAYERYSMLMLASYDNNKTWTDPATINDRNLGAHKFEKLAGVYDVPALIFLQQLRRLRNCIVHYNGVYSKTNVLDYTFDQEVYFSAGNEGAAISINLDTIVWVHAETIKIVCAGNSNFFTNY